MFLLTERRRSEKFMENKALFNKGRIIFLLFLLFSLKGIPMEINLNLPWGKNISPPAKPFIFFYSKEKDNLIFEKSDFINIYCKVGYRSISLNWELSKNLFKKSFLQGKGIPLFANTFLINIPAKDLKPGFYDLKVYIDVGEEKKIDGICTFGYEIEKIKYLIKKPKDFMKFWNEGLKKINSIPLDAREEFIRKMKGKEIDQYNVTSACLPPRYDIEGIKYDEIEVYKVNFQSINGLRVYGYLAKPSGKGPFPAMLVLPGAGYRSEPIPAEHARHGYVALDIQVHNQEVDLQKYEKPEWEKRQLNYNNPKTSEYYTIYLNCIQAINYLCSREDVDKEKIVAVGGSQGGRLSLVVAGLDKRIKAIVPAIPHGGYQIYLKWVNYCNSKNIDGMDKEIPEIEETPADKFYSYFDPVNFASEIECPVLMNIGLVDRISPPCCAYVIFKEIKSKNKEIVFLPNLSHDWCSEFDRYAWRWLEKQLFIKK